MRLLSAPSVCIWMLPRSVHSLQGPLKGSAYHTSRPVIIYCSNPGKRLAINDCHFLFYYVEMLTELLISGGLLLLCEPAPMISTTKKRHVAMRATRPVVIEALNVPGPMVRASPTSRRLQKKRIKGLVATYLCRKWTDHDLFFSIAYGTVNQAFRAGVSAVQGKSCSQGQLLPCFDVVHEA